MNKKILINLIYYVGGIVAGTVATLILSSCKTSKPDCDAYSSIDMPYSTTIKMEQIHKHNEYQKICTYFPESSHVIGDTFKLTLRNIK